ncbi:MAG: hypothetical protein QOG35_1632 [Solirubrobacteraceae bacterium]|jgi:hypothetical protein|nr:hypothetical protein [Solirubrobacteraceae bacterium]
MAPNAKDIADLRASLQRVEAKCDAIAFMLGGPGKDWILEIDKTGASGEVKRRKTRRRRELSRQA